MIDICYRESDVVKSRFLFRFGDHGFREIDRLNCPRNAGQQRRVLSRPAPYLQNGIKTEIAEQSAHHLLIEIPRQVAIRIVGGGPHFIGLPDSCSREVLFHKLTLKPN